MNQMNDPNPPPIPSAFEPLPEIGDPTIRGEWKDAPKIVKGWAYPLTWLAIIVLPIIIVAVMLPSSNANGLPERIGMGFFYFVFWAVAVWQNRALKSGDKSAWTIQIILSVLGLLGFPVGTLIHGYILSQWFQPETKAWFGQK